MLISFLGSAHYLIYSIEAVGSLFAKLYPTFNFENIWDAFFNASVGIIYRAVPCCYCYLIDGYENGDLPFFIVQSPMATPLRFLAPLKLKAFPLKPAPLPTPSCSPSPNPTSDYSDASFDSPADGLSPTDPSLAVAKRVPSGISLRSGPVLCPLEPPNFEIGWKRTKEIKVEKPRGWLIADFLEKLEGLMSRGRFGSTKLLAKAAGIVAERAREEAEVLRAHGEVDDRLVTELQRVLRLVELDAEMVKVAVKEETLKERIETARARCRQAVLVALSL